MKVAVIIILAISLFFIPSFASAIETTTGITDREVVERLTRVEAKLDSLEKNMKQLREDINIQFGRIDSQFNRLAAIFTALVVAIIGFAIWDRRTMIKPFETKVREIEDDIVGNSAKLRSIIDALRTLSKSDERVAGVLRKFNLL